MVVLMSLNGGGGERKAYRILVVKSLGKPLLGKPRRRWEDYITLNLLVK
jgi:hypothetical protein